MHSLPRVENLLQLMNLHWHIIITQSHSLPQELSFGVKHSMGLDKYDIYLSLWYHKSILNILYAPPIHPSPSLPKPDNH